jgi:hypothetical protein
MKLTLMRALISCGLLTGFAACGDDVSIEEWGGYGNGQPGADLPEGGEILMERVLLSSTLTGADPVVQSWFHGYAYDGVGAALNGPKNGECVKLTTNTTFPAHIIGPGSTYTDLGDSLHVTGPGADVTIPKNVAGPEGLRDNRPNPNRLHHEGAFLYGGPAWQGEGLADVSWEAGAEYTIDVNNGTPLTMAFPRSYAVPMEMDTKVVSVPATGDWTPEWEALENPDGKEHLRGYDFAFIAFANTDGGGTAMFLCPADDKPGSDGSVLIPESVIAQIPDQGIIQAGRYTHWQDRLTADAEVKIDLFAIWCHIGTYAKE